MNVMTSLVRIVTCRTSSGEEGFMLDIVAGIAIATKYQIWDGALSKYIFQSFSLPLQANL